MSQQYQVTKRSTIPNDKTFNNIGNSPGAGSLKKTDTKLQKKEHNKKISNLKFSVLKIEFPMCKTILKIITL
jgi:hypothetical protein